MRIERKITAKSTQSTKPGVKTFQVDVSNPSFIPGGKVFDVSARNVGSITPDTYVLSVDLRGQDVGTTRHAISGAVIQVKDGDVLGERIARMFYAHHGQKYPADKLTQLPSIRMESKEISKA